MDIENLDEVSRPGDTTQATINEGCFTQAQDNFKSAMTTFENGVRQDRYGNSIETKKRNKTRPLMSNHKVTFVDQIQNRTKQLKAHPETEENGDVLTNPSLNI